MQIEGFAAIVTGGALSWFASTHPDGLEWSIDKITGRGEPGLRCSRTKVSTSST